MFGEDFYLSGLVFVAAIFIFSVLLLSNLGYETIYEYERGLLYRRGKFVGILDPGRHRFFKASQRIYKLDIRLQSVTIPGQDVLSSDNVSIKVSLAAGYKVSDPYRAVNETVSYHEALYQLLQLETRDLIGSTPIDDLLAKRKEIGDALLAATKPKADAFGIEVVSVGIKDVMFPGELKNVFAQVVNARKEGLAALERARGDSAALRNLANTAKLLEDNPALLQLRTLQALGEKSGNTLVLNLGSSNEADLPVLKKKISK
jgi:regulator of protease activity HflC (stomatin/prohibitin superfamily)